MRTIKKLSLLFFCLIMATLATELVLQATHNIPSISHNWLLKPYWMKDSDTLFISDNVRKTLNIIGSISPDKTVIVTMGDSFTQGDPVPLDKSYPAVLEKKLTASGLNNQIINLGVGGYGNDQSFVLFMRALERGLKPDVVVWSFFSNDINENIYQATYDISADSQLVRMDATQNWIYRKQAAYDRIPLPRDIKRHSALANHLFHIFEKDRQASVPERYPSYHDQESWSLQKISLQVQTMNQLAEELDFEFYPVLITPQVNYLDDEYLRTSMQGLIQAEQKIRNIIGSEPNFISMNFTHLSEVSVLGSSTENQESDLDYAHVFFDDGKRDPMPFGNRHFNEKGYEFFAEVIKKAIESNSIPL